LADTHPEWAAQADGWDPKSVRAGSKLRLSWRCKFGHSWIARPQDRRKAGCPYCSGRRVLAGFSDFATRYPVLAVEADGWDPRTVTIGSNRRLTWKCSRGHKWIATPKHRKDGDGCPFCSGKRPIVGETDLASLMPNLAKEADGWDPTTVTLKSGAYKNWRCSKNHRWNARVADRANGNGCPFCSGRSLIVGSNDVATRCRDILDEVSGWDPRTVHSGSSKPVEWRCRVGHHWQASPKARRGGSGCPVCSNNEVRVGVNDLATVDPELAKQLVQGETLLLSRGSTKKVLWKCHLDHEWKASVADRSAGQGCPICAGRRVLKGFNDLLSRRPDIAREAFQWDPSTVTQKSGLVREWRCDKGHLWKTSVATRSNGFGCPICVNQQVLVGYNDLLTTHPEIAREAEEWDPSSLTAGSYKRRKWKCDQGHKWVAAVKSRAINGTGCPSCAKFGFRPNKEAWLYLIENEYLELLQIGITNQPKDRLRSHKRGGWELLDLRGPMDGHLTQKLEIDCLHALENRCAVLGHKAGIEKFDGYTESWTKQSLNVTSIKQILDWVYEDEMVDAKATSADQIQ